MVSKWRWVGQGMAGDMTTEASGSPDSRIRLKVEGIGLRV